MWVLWEVLLLFLLLLLLTEHQPISQRSVTHVNRLLRSTLQPPTPSPRLLWHSRGARGTLGAEQVLVGKGELEREGPSSAPVW